MLKPKITNYNDQPMIVDEGLIFEYLEDKYGQNSIKLGITEFNELLNDFYHTELDSLRCRYTKQRISVSQNALTSYVNKFVFRKLVENIFYNIEKNQSGATKGFAVYIYGSVARNSSPVKSDIDYFVVCNHKNSAAQDKADLICGHIQRGLSDLGIIFDDSHMNTPISEADILNELSDEELEVLIDNNILRPYTLDSYIVDHKYYSFSQITQQYNLSEELNDKLYKIWRDTHDYIQLFLDDSLDVEHNPFIYFHDEVTAFTAISDSWEVADNGSEFAGWRTREFKDYVNNNKAKLKQHFIALYNGVNRDRNNYDAYQAYLFIHFEAAASYSRLSKMRKMQVYQSTEILQDVFQQGLNKLLNVINNEFGAHIPEEILLQITNYFNIKFVHMEKEMKAGELYNAAIDINSGLSDILLFALGQFPFKPLQQVVQEITKKDCSNYLDYKYFEQRMMFYYKKYNKKYLQEFLFGRNYFVPFEGYHKLLVAHIRDYFADPKSFHQFKDSLIEAIASNNKEYFNKGFLFVLKEDAQRIIDTLEWLLKMEFVAEDGVFITEGISLGLRKKIINEDEYLLLKNFKRLIIFMRYYSNLSSRSSISAAAFRQLLFGFADIHDLEAVLHLPRAEIEKLSIEAFTRVLKENYQQVLRIYLRVIKEL